MRRWPQTGTVQPRVRDLPARVVVYLLLAGCLFAELGYRQVWQRLIAGLRRPAVPDPDRRRVDPGPPPARGRRRCGRCSTCCAARPPTARHGRRCGGVGCWCARSTAPP